MNHPVIIKKVWLNLGGSFLLVAVVAGMLFAALRAIGTLGPQAYRFVLPLGFICMALMPFIFLTRHGRRTIGLVKSISKNYYLYAIFAGAAMALLCFSLGIVLFGISPNNWFISIRSSYYNTFDTTGTSIGTLFVIFTLPALVFSPIGEEIFFRGFLQEALTAKFSYNNAILIDSLFFALIHLFHHGFVKDKTGEIHFYLVSGLIWVLLMFITAIIFAWLKKSSGSVFPAIAAHLIFNLVMNVIIFYAL